MTTDNNLYHSIMDNYYTEYIDIIKDLHVKLEMDFYFQKYPNLRYNTSDDKYPVWHVDKHFGHHTDEINVMIPITNDDFGFEIIGNVSHLFKYFSHHFLNTKVIKFILNKLSKKYHYLNEIIVFDSYHLHTASNRESYTNPRISIDLRLLPIKHKKVYGKSMRGIDIKPGHYFSEHPISHYL